MKNLILKVWKFKNSFGFRVVSLNCLNVSSAEMVWYRSQNEIFVKIEIVLCDIKVLCDINILMLTILIKLLHQT